ncbi:hypothetical protein [Brevibacillus sp. DP1.3A]|uniref:phage tail assembly chaperone n=1 Tax=Brevibacillus sp. DP1.3A TaxID=2738867 RepID=UPI00156BA388|nr:hypothetical protein [Brevibacillus sp. DP1.3A]UED78052.1 hypothetical protein HP399_030820 [Brevibacillus sp. DP1.3A]
MSKKITIADLIAQKERIKKRKAKTMTLYVESLDGEIIVQEPEKSISVEALTMVQDDTRSEMADTFLAYHCVIEPNLKDVSLQQAYGCAEPTDIVNMIFRQGEISAIGGHALQLAGYATGVRKVETELKN